MGAGYLHTSGKVGEIMESRGIFMYVNLVNTFEACFDFLLSDTCKV